MKLSLTSASILLFSFALHAEVYKVRTIVKQNKTQIVGVQETKFNETGLERKKIFSMPLFLPEGAPASEEIFEEYLVSSKHLSQKEKGFLLETKKSQNKLLALGGGVEMRTLIQQGPTENRIDLTILGDGYTEGEREKFFADTRRSYEGLFDGKTFANYQPLFNIHAVFVPSQESGIGDGSPKNTAFALYRNPKGSKRAIMPGNTGALERAISYAPDTDYPIVIANDDYYGGLGGRYAISTRSLISGLIVLRHELGHNFGQIGEEYDNGYVYRGANSTTSPDARSWAHWSNGTIQNFEATLLTGDYVWSNLADAPYSATFSIPEKHSVLTADISSVGWDTPDDVSIRLDGKDLPVEGRYHADRSFFRFGPVQGLSSSTHRVDIQEKKKDGNNVLGFALFHSYPADYDFSPNKIGAFSTFDDNGRKSYRPTHSSCLMRDMTVENFCVVDQENIWLQFLNRVSLIDEVEISNNGDKLVAKVKTPKLPGLKYSWYKAEWTGERPILENSTSASIELPKGPQYRVRVSFTTPDVRKQSSLLSATKDFR